MLDLSFVVVLDGVTVGRTGAFFVLTKHENIKDSYKCAAYYHSIKNYYILNQTYYLKKNTNTLKIHFKRS